MKRLITILFTILALVSCGKGQVSEGELPNCYQEDQSGYYLMSFSIQESNCGMIPLMEATIDNGIIHPTTTSGCVLDSSTWKQADCSTTTQFTCNKDTFDMSLEWILVSYIDDGSRITGKLYLAMEDAAGFCEGWYYLNSRRVKEFEE